MSKWLREAVWSWDFGVAFVAGAGAVALGTISSVRANAVTVNLAEAGISAGALATILAGLAIFTTFFDPGYRRALELDDAGIGGALRPYAIVAFVAAAGTAVAIVAAIADPAVHALGAALVLAAPTLLCVWAIFGMASLASITIGHAKRRSKLQGGVEEAERIYRRRVAERRGSRSG